MYKIYFKQAIEILKQSKLMSFITIIGMAVAIMMIMVIILTYSIKNTSIAPEENRHRTLYLKNERQDSKSSRSFNSILYQTYHNYLSDLKTPELVTAIQQSWNNSTITGKDQMEYYQLPVKYIDANFWKYMSFTFTEGNPFSDADFNSGLKKAVISESAAHKLYGNENPLNKTIEIEFDTYTVIGIVKDVSPVFNYAYADIYAPYTSQKGYDKTSYSILLLAKNERDFGAIENEVKAAERKFNSVVEDKELTLYGPYTHRIQQMGDDVTDEQIKKNDYRMIFILSILLIIPAVNLSSFSMSRIRRRTEEIGIRKAFGAKNHTIMFQVLYENFITSLIGGIIGLILSYIAVIWLKEWLLGVGSEKSVPIEIFISLPVFLAVFIVCILLSIISAAIPAYKASKTIIIDSINQNNSKSL